MLTAVTGINWGDEGKGRVIDNDTGQSAQLFSISVDGEFLRMD